MNSANQPNLAVAIPSIMNSRDKDWLQGFRTRSITAKNVAILAAIDARLAELNESEFRSALKTVPSGLTFEKRIDEAVRVYEQVLTTQNGKKTRALRNRNMLRRLGYEEAVRQTVLNSPGSNGLKQLAELDRLDCSYEQIVLDFEDRFTPDVADKAHANLRRATEANAP